MDDNKLWSEIAYKNNKNNPNKNTTNTNNTQQQKVNKNNPNKNNFNKNTTNTNNTQQQKVNKNNPNKNNFNKNTTNTNNTQQQTVNKNLDIPPPHITENTYKLSQENYNLEADYQSRSKVLEFTNDDLYNMGFRGSNINPGNLFIGQAREYPNVDISWNNQNILSMKEAQFELSSKLLDLITPILDIINNNTIINVLDSTNTPNTVQNNTQFTNTSCSLIKSSQINTAIQITKLFQQVNQDILDYQTSVCSVCGNKQNIFTNMNIEHCTLKVNWGFESTHDTETHELVLCNKCYDDHLLGSYLGKFVKKTNYM